MYNREVMDKDMFDMDVFLQASSVTEEVVQHRSEAQHSSDR